jgi:sugar lactone lactonase YvrE
MTLEMASPPGAYLAESPVWDASRERLLWVDILDGRVEALDMATGERATFSAGEPVGALALRRAGGLVLAVEHGFATLDPEWRSLETVATVDQPGAPWRFNDGKCDPAGRFWAGTVAYDEAPSAGLLYCLAADGTVGEVLRDVTVSNGLAWSPDERVMYYVDSPTREIHAFDFDVATGAIGARRRLVEVEDPAGLPDGMTTDCDGCLWVALWGGAAVRRYTPDGALDREIRLPTSHVTSCTFGGADLGTLFVTTAREGLSPADLNREPQAGAVFAIDVDQRGLPAHDFAG